jgi:glutaredoxin
MRCSDTKAWPTTDDLLICTLQDEPMTMQTRITLLVTLALALLSQASMAQPVYKIVGPDGKVTFSDKPPPSAEKSKVATPGASVGGLATGSDLPYELRQVASKYPVTLYTAASCTPCDTGRSLLKSRGIPFNERTVSTPEDQEALLRLAGDNSLPYATIGSQKLKGFSDLEWTQYLNAAGYPGTSTLPKGYRFATPTPLVTVQKPAIAPKEAPEPAKPTPSAAPPAGPAPSI